VKNSLFAVLALIVLSCPILATASTDTESASPQNFIRCNYSGNIKEEAWDRDERTAARKAEDQLRTREYREKSECERQENGQFTSGTPFTRCQDLHNHFSCESSEWVSCRCSQSE
jgi:hypothetical protein